MTKWGRYLRTLSLGSVLGMIPLLLYPASSTRLRLALVAAVAIGWVGLTAQFWNRRALRIGLLVIPLVGAIPFALPGRAIDREALRQDYLRRMAGLEGTRYFWGGETARGIDCSGLPRKALRDALFINGIRQMNGHLLRGGLELWWFDSSAKALSEGYRRYPSRPPGRLRRWITPSCGRATWR